MMPAAITTDFVNTFPRSDTVSSSGSSAPSSSIATPTSGVSISPLSSPVALKPNPEPLEDLPPNVWFDVPGTARAIIRARYRDNSPAAKARARTPPRVSTLVDEAKSDLPYLIGHYGTAASSSWLEQRYKIWRSELHTTEQPRVQGYLEAHGVGHGFIYAWGDPLTLETDEERQATADEMYEWAKKHHKHLVWCCVTDEFSRILSNGVGSKRKGWSTLSCIREDVLHPSTARLTSKDIKHNIRRAEKEHVSIEELYIDEPTWLPDEKTRKEIEDGIAAWRANRHGRQIASASLLPWLDASSRRYFIARTPERIVAVCILTPIAHNSFQIKNSVSFPFAPHGTSEALLTKVIQQLGEEGRTGLSFGASAEKELTLEANLGGWSIKMLSKGYSGIMKKTKLAARGHFRSKFGTTEAGQGEALHVSFPQHGMGWRGLIGLMSVLTA